MNAYNNLRGGTRRRLNEYKGKARHIAHGIACREAQRKGEPSPALADMPAERWKEWRYIYPHGLGFNAPHGAYIGRSEMHGRACIHADTGYLDHLRSANADDMPRDFPTEYYSDAHCSETIGGRVTALPRGRFLAWVKWSDADGITIIARPFDDAEDAAREADRLAERLAEDEREYSEKWNRARELQDENDSDRAELRTIRQNVSGQVALIRAGKGNREAICDYIGKLREEFAELLEKMGERRDELADLIAEGVEV